MKEKSFQYMKTKTKKERHIEAHQCLKVYIDEMTLAYKRACKKQNITFLQYQYAILSIPFESDVFSSFSLRANKSCSSYLQIQTYSCAMQMSLGRICQRNACVQWYMQWYVKCELLCVYWFIWYFSVSINNKNHTIYTSYSR